MINIDNDDDDDEQPNTDDTDVHNARGSGKFFERKSLKTVLFEMADCSGIWIKWVPKRNKENQRKLFVNSNFAKR